jgi:hypothetical protein
LTRQSSPKPQRRKLRAEFSKLENRLKLLENYFSETDVATPLQKLETEQIHMNVRNKLATAEGKQRMHETLGSG